MGATALLTGVIPDEALPLAPGVPTNTRKQLNIPIGSNFKISFQLLKRNGQVVHMAVNSVTFTLKKFPQDQTPTFPKVVGPSAASDNFDILITPANTKNAAPGLYTYDVWYTDPNDNSRCSVVPVSAVYLEYADTLP